MSLSRHPAGPPAGRRRAAARTTARTAARTAGTGALLVALAGSVTAGASGGAPDPVRDVVVAARAQLGEAYAWGGNGPERWDCSGLTSVLWGHVGGVRGMPRVSRDQARWVVPLQPDQVRPGDLVFYGDPVDHVGLYTGDGLMVDASSSQGRVMERRVWRATTLRYGRVPRPTMPAVAAVPGGSGAPEPLPTPPVASTGHAPALTGPGAAPVVRRPAPAPAPARPPAPRPRPATGAAAATRAPGASTPPAAARGSRKPVPVAPAAADALGRRVATLAASAVGQPWADGGAGRGYDDVELALRAWERAGGPVLPASRSGLVRATTPVTPAQARPGDLVFFGNPASYVAVYAGNGRMVGASKSLGRVVARPVFTTPVPRYARVRR